MRPVESIEDRARQVVTEQITASYAKSGSAVARIDDLVVTVDEWRALARKVARGLGRPVTTTVAGPRVHAVLRDWPANEDEAERGFEAMRRAMEAMPRVPPPTVTPRPRRLRAVPPLADYPARH